MNSSTLQFLVAGALIAAWAWMLGRPILTNLFRRSRRDSVGHFRYQQAVLGRPLDEDPFNRRSVTQTVLQPFRDWRGQPLERRRLQVMLGFSFATFFSLLTAIAFRGSAIRLFLIMAVCFAAYLGYAAYVGAAQIRRQEHRSGAVRRTSANRRRAQRSRQADTRVRAVAPSVDYDEGFELADEEYTSEIAASDEEDLYVDEGVRLTRQQTTDESVEEIIEDEDDLLVAEASDPFDGSEGFGTGDFEDGFFEPIPELQFAPLNLDASIIKPTEPAEAVEEIVAEYTEDIDHIEYTDEIEGVHEAEDIVPLGEESLGVEESDVEATEPAATVTEAELDEPQVDNGPAFTAPPRQRQRPARKKARPIYIESVLDEVDDQQRVVND